MIYGPDHRLYLGGPPKVHAISINKQLVITKRCSPSFGDTSSYLDPRNVNGLAFNPRTNDRKLHVTTSPYRWATSAGSANGKIEIITMDGPGGYFNSDRKDLITGLPVSSYVSKFLPSGALLIAVGGTTNGGMSSMGNFFSRIPDNPRSCAIVTCPATETAMKYRKLNDPTTAEISGGACRPYVTGFRLLYDMAYHISRNVYGIDNGMQKGYGDFPNDCVGRSKPGKNIDSKLFKVAPGKCHGHPNLNRKECVYDDPKCVQPLLRDIQFFTDDILEYRSNCLVNSSEICSSGTKWLDVGSQAACG